MPIVKMPDGTKVQFPDDMPADQIRSMITSKFPELAPKPGLLDRAKSAITGAMAPTSAIEGADVSELNHNREQITPDSPIQNDLSTTADRALTNTIAQQLPAGGTPMTDAEAAQASMAKTSDFLRHQDTNPLNASVAAGKISPEQALSQANEESSRINDREAARAAMDQQAAQRAHLEALRIQATGDNATPEAIKAYQDAQSAAGNAFLEKQRVGIFKNQHEIISGLKSGTAQIAGSLADMPQFAADTVNNIAVNPFLNLFGVSELAPTKRFEVAKDLEQVASKYRPDIANKPLSELKGAGEISDWIATQAAIQAPQMVGSTGAAFIPKLRAGYLGIMGASSGALQYQQDLEKKVNPRAAWLDGTTNGLFEILGEALPFEAFDKLGDIIKKLPVSQRAPVITEAFKKTMVAVGAMTAQHASEGIGEGLTQLGQNASQRYIAGDKSQELMAGVPEAAAIGAIMATPMAIPHAYHAAMGAEQPVFDGTKTQQVPVHHMAAAHEAAADVLVQPTVDDAIRAAEDSIGTKSNDELLNKLNILAGIEPSTSPATGGMAATSPSVEQQAAPIQETSNAIPEPAAALPESNNLPVGAAGPVLRSDAGTGVSTEPGANGAPVVGGELAATAAERTGNAEAVNARPAVEPTAKPVALTPVSKRTQEKINAPAEKAAETVKSEAPATEAAATVTPVFGTNSAGKITLRGVPMEQIQAVRDKLGLKGVIVGKDSAVFPKGTDLKALQSEFGIVAEKQQPKAKKKPIASTDLLMRIKQLGGINSKYASDLTGEQKPKGAWKFAFGKNGLGLDDLASQLSAEGFNIDLNDATDNGGVNQLTEMVRQHIGGERNFKTATQEAAAETSAEDRDYVAMRQRAEELGINVKGLGNRELADAIYAAEDDIAMAAVAEQERLNEAEQEALAAVMADETVADDELDIPFGDNMPVDRAAMDAHFGVTDEKTDNGKTDVAARAEPAQGAERGQQGSEKPQGSESPLLTSYTNAEVLAREAAKAKAEEEVGKEAPAKNVTADQVDMFAQQDSLFSSNREQPAAPEKSNKIVSVKDVYGRTHDVRESDLTGDAERIPTVRKNGETVAGEEIPRSIIEGEAKSKKLEVLRAQAQGKITGDQGAALKELADAGEHAAVDEVLKPAQENDGYTLASHSDMEARVREGTMSAAEFKASFEALLKNKAGIVAELEKFTKPQLFEKYPGLAYRYKNEKKADGIDAVYRDMMQDYTLGESLVYSMGKSAMENSLRAMVERTTDESLAKYAENVKQNKADREAARAEALAGMENPETLEDYQRLMGAKAKEMGEGVTFQQVRMSLPLEQRIKYDELVSEFNRGERAKKKTAQQEQSIRAPGEPVTATEIIKTRHTKHGHDLWQFNIDQRVSGDEFKSLVGQAKRLGGDYSSYRGNGAIPGWQFRTEEAAKAFKALIAGDTAQAKDVMQARRDAYADDRSQTAVERLTEMADALDEKADASLNQDRKANTARRARFAASAEASANSDKAMAQTMRNIATGIENGTAKLLDRVRQKVQVEALQGFIRTAFQEQFQKYADQEKNQPSIETADYAKYPSYTAYRSDLAGLGRSLLEVEGTMKLGQRLMKVADDVTDAYLTFAKDNLLKVSAFSTKDGARAAFPNKASAEASIARSGYKGAAIVLPIKRNENLIILSPSEAIKRGIWEGDNDKRISLSPDFGEELVEKIGKAARRGAKVSVPWQLENAYDSRKRLAGMNIETPAELRAALREFIGLRETAKQPDKIKEMERAMIGRKNDGFDFFPTPAVASDEAIEAADIKEGMTIYEPQAGMGHIADRLREAGFEPDVGEIATDRRELLEAKGYNVVSRDFMDMRLEDTPNGEGYDRIIMNPPFSDRRDAMHVQHAYGLLKPGGRMVSIMGEGVFFGQDRKAESFREWLDKVGGTEEKLEQGTFLDPTLPVNTGVSARMVVIDKPEGGPLFSKGSPVTNAHTPDSLRQSIINAFDGKAMNAVKAMFDSGKAKAITSEEAKGIVGEDALYSKAPAFYSQLAKQIDATPDRIFQTGKQVVMWLESNSAKLGIKKDEIEATGITDWLKLQGKVSKAEVQNFIKQGGVQVQDVMLGRQDEVSQAEKWMDNYARQEFGSPFNELSESDQDRIRGRAEDNNFEPEDNTKFKSYQLPGGENYRELLLTLPVAQGNPTRWQVIDQSGKMLNVFDSYKLAEDFLTRNDSFYSGLNIRQFGNDAETFKSSHFDQPNILAHIRFNERTDEDGKRVLFLEEIQSDWGQKGKKTGFKARETKPLAKGEWDQIVNAWKEELAQKWSEKLGLADARAAVSALPYADVAKYIGKELELAEFEARNNDDFRQSHPQGQGFTPSAPFVTDTKSWTALALKRMIAYAAENGFDRVAWTTGEQQAARYDLSKQVKQLRYFDNGDGTFDLEVYTERQDQMEAINNAFLNKSADEMEDLVGKEIVKKMVAGEGAGESDSSWKTLSGGDLKVGGEGMKGYYDQIVPQVANDILKRMSGGKVESVRVETYAASKSPSGYQITQNQQGFTITPELRSKVQTEGLPMFSKSGQAKAFYDPASDTSYFISDQISKDAKPEDIKGLALHEISVHALRLGKDSAEFNSILQQLEMMKKAGNKKVLEAYDRVPLDTRAEDVSQEALAYLVEYNSTLPVMKRVWAWFRNALRALGKNMPMMQRMKINEWANSLQESDLIWLAHDAMTSERVAEPSGEYAMASRGEQSGNSFARMFMEEFVAENDAAFKHKKSTSKNLNTVLDEVAKAEYAGDGTRADENQESGADERHFFTTETGHSFQVFETPKEVWIDVSKLEPRSGGQAIYAAVANYAYNTGKKFIGDPNGLSRAAVIRRTSNMLSSALQFGTTRHIEPSNQQIKGDIENGIAPLDWRGQDIDKIEALAQTLIETAHNIAPQLKEYKYDFQSQQFTDGKGRPVTGAAMAANIPRVSGIGEATARRVVLYQSLISAGSEGVGKRSQILEQLLRWGNTNASQREGGYPDNLTKLFSKSAPAAIPEETNTQAVQRVVQDKMVRFQVIEDWLKSQGKALSERASVWTNEGNMYGKIAARSEDFREKTVKPLIEKTQKAGFTMGQVAEYLEMKHIPEANARMRQIHGDPDATANGVEDSAAKAVLAQYQALPNFAKLDAIASEWQAITASTRDILVNAGIISSDMAEAWKATYQNYVPLKGDEEQTGSGTGKGLNVNGKTKRRLGHGDREEAVIQNMLRDHERAIQLEEKNNVGISLVHMAVEAQNQDLITVGKPERRQVYKDKTAFEVQYKGVPVGSFDTMRDAQDFILRDAALAKRQGSSYGIAKSNDPTVVFMASPMLAENEVNVYINGHTVRVQLNDELLAQAYTNMGVEHVGLLLTGAREFNSWLSKAYTGFNPEFALVNLSRDMFAGSINLTGDYGVGMTAKIYAHYPRAFKELVKSFRDPANSKLISDYRAAGGNTGAAYLSDLERIGKDVMGAYNEYAGTLDTLGRTYSENRQEGRGKFVAGAKATGAAISAGYKHIPFIGHFLTLMEHVNAVTENALRVATFDTLRRNGYSDAKAAQAAKMSTVNFNRKGEISNAAGALYLFFNPSVQGIQRATSVLTSSKHKGQARALAGMMTLGAFAIAEAMRGGDDDDKKKWKQTPDYVKDRNIVINLGDDEQFTIPLPYEYSLFWSLGNMLSDAIHGANGWKLGVRLSDAIMGNFSPIGNPIEGGEATPVQILPTALKMIVAPTLGSEGQDSFGRPLLPKKFSEAKPDSQTMFRSSKGSPYASIAEGLNSATGGDAYHKGHVDISPETLKYWVSSLTGGTGKFAMDSITLGSNIAQGVDTVELREMPVVRKFVRESGVSDARQLFYTHSKEAKEKADALMFAKQARDPSGAQKIVGEDLAEIKLAAYSAAYHKQLKAYSDLVDAIRLDDKLTLNEKRLQMKMYEKKEQAVYDAFDQHFTKLMREKTKP